jgi:acetyltransferase-like isoleucine patch superfamily enzyme
MLLRLIGVQIKINCDTSGNLFILNGKNLAVGSNSNIGMYCKIYDFESIEIGSDNLISHQVTMISGTHYNDKTRHYRPAPIVIGSNVWIGINVTIVGPVSIGDNATIAASSLVIRDVPSDTTVGGIPAKRIK